MAGNIGQVLEIDESLSAAEQAKQLRNRLRLLGTLRRVVALDDISVLIVGPDGEVQGELPTALSIADLQLDVLATGQSIADNRGKLAFAAAPAAGPAGRQYIVVVSRRIDAGLGPAFVLFIWASGATILLALGAAYLLGRRLTRPIREASTATQHIAAGQLSTRITEPPAHHHDELAELSRNVNAMAASLERSRGLEQQFLLSVTHDLRTPLTSIRGYAEAIDDGNVDPKRAAAVIRAESARLERLVTDLLELAKLQARAFTFTMAPVDLSAAAHTVTAAAAGSKPGITFHPVTTGPLLVQADPDRLAQALANLVENAGKYATSAVMVSTRRGPVGRAHGRRRRAGHRAARPAARLRAAVRRPPRARATGELQWPRPGHRARTGHRDGRRSGRRQRSERRRATVDPAAVERLTLDSHHQRCGRDCATRLPTSATPAEGAAMSSLPEPHLARQVTR